MAGNLKIGIVVKLKSNEPLMSVQGNNTSQPSELSYIKESLVCIWFDNADLKQGTFAIETLIKLVYRYQN